MKPAKRLKWRALTSFALVASAALATSVLFACSDLAGLGDTPVVSSVAGPAALPGPRRLVIRRGGRWRLQRLYRVELRGRVDGVHGEQRVRGL